MAARAALLFVRKEPSLRHILTLCLVTVALPASAETAAPENTDTIVVTASRVEQRRQDVGQAITVLTVADIQTRQTATVSDLLRTTPGVTVTRYGGVGTLTGLSVRGAESDQTLVLIDGVRVNDPSSTGNGFDFGSLLTGNVSRIEVLRGPNSVIWGSQAIGGVVDVQTFEPTGHLAVNARAEGGYRGTAQVVGNVSGKAGPVSASVGAGYFTTEGISAFSEARGGRERDGYENVGANAKVRVRMAENVDLDLRGYYSDGKVGVDGYGPPPTFTFGDTREVDYTKQYLGYAGLNVSLLGGRFRNRFAFTYSDTDRHNRDPDAMPTTTFEGKGKLERFEYQGVLDVMKPLTLVFGAETERSSFSTASPNQFAPNPVPTHADVRISSGYAQAIVKPVEGVTLTGGLRHDAHDTFGGETTFGGNAAITPNHGATVLRATYAEGFKAPTLFQLLSNYGNRALRPERARSYDLGVEQRLLDGGIVAGITYFSRITRNQIDFIFCGPGDPPAICVNRPKGTYDNILRTRAEGVEAMIALKPIQGLNVSAQYTHVNARNRSPGFDQGLELPRRPRDTASVIADYRTAFGLGFGATVTLVGNSFDDTSNTTPLQGYALVDLRASFALRPGIELYGRVENVGDAKYETIFQYGTIGRAAYGGVRVAF